MKNRYPRASTGGARPERDGAKPSPDSAAGPVRVEPEDVEAASASVETLDPPNPIHDGHSSSDELGAPTTRSSPTEATSGSDESVAESPRRRPTKHRARSGAQHSQQPFDGRSDPTTLHELLIAMVRIKDFQPTKRAVKAAKPTSSITQEHVDAINKAIADDSSFAAPLAFLRAVLLTGPSKRTLEQALTIVEESLRARFRDLNSATDEQARGEEDGTGLTDWMEQLVTGEDESVDSHIPESENLVSVIVVLRAARSEIQAGDVPNLLTSTGRRRRIASKGDSKTAVENALDALAFVSLLGRDQLTQRALVVAAEHIEGFRAQARDARAEKVALTERQRSAEEKALDLSRELASIAASERELRKDLAEAKTEIERSALRVLELARELENSQNREAEVREWSEQRRIDDSNSYEALRASASRNRRKDVELLAEAVAALKKDDPKLLVALDRVELVLKSMEREREELRTEGGRVSGAETDV